mgnify:CR=1 FL=1
MTFQFLAAEETVRIWMPILIAVGTVLLTVGLAQSATPSEVATPDRGSVKSIEDQLPGFPIEFPFDDLFYAPWNMRGLVFADLDGTPGLEVIYSFQNRFPPHASEGFVAAWDQNGHEVDGFPVTTVGGAFFAPSVGDLDNDGTPEIVQVTVDEGYEARLYVIEHDGAVRPGFPVTAGTASIADGATLYDLDGDSMLEIVYISDQDAHVFEADGSEWTSGWPVPLTESAHGTPAVGDVDRDGRPEIFFTEWNRMHLLDIDGNELPGWPLEIDGARFAVLSSAALADLDDDRDLEIVVPALRGDMPRETTTEVHVFQHDGTIVPGWPQQEWIESTECAPIVTDLEGDGTPEILIGSELITVEVDPPVTIHNARVYAWDASGNAKPGFPWTTDRYTSAITMLTAADMDGDGSIEIFADAGLRDQEGRGYVFGLDAEGQELTGFPLRPTGETTLNGAVLGDVDLDGDLELGAVSFTSSGASMSLYVNVYDLPGTYRKWLREWPTFHARNQRGGVAKRSYRGWRVVYADRPMAAPQAD